MCACLYPGLFTNVFVCLPSKQRTRRSSHTSASLSSLNTLFLVRPSVVLLASGLASGDTPKYSNTELKLIAPDRRKVPYLALVMAVLCILILTDFDKPWRFMDVVGSSVSTSEKVPDEDDGELESVLLYTSCIARPLDGGGGGRGREGGEGR